MHDAFKSLLIVLLLIGGVCGHAEEVEPWRNSDVLRAAFAIGLSQEQQPQFRELLTEFLQGYGADVRKLLQGTNLTNVRRKIAAKRRSRVKDMDDGMRAMLAESQYPAYENYRDTLLEKMDERAAAQRR